METAETWRAIRRVAEEHHAERRAGRWSLLGVGCMVVGGLLFIGMLSTVLSDDIDRAKRAGMLPSDMLATFQAEQAIGVVLLLSGATMLFYGAFGWRIRRRRR